MTDADIEKLMADLGGEEENKSSRGNAGKKKSSRGNAGKKKSSKKMGTTGGGM